LLIIVGVVAAAWYAEPIGYFFRLRTWDKEAPAREVLNFLRSDNEKQATQYLASRELKPLEKDGKWLGYLMVSNAGTMWYIMSELAPKDSNVNTESKFQYIGEGSAEVLVPDSNGKQVKYRLIMTPSGWKITDILGGKPQPR
jgi:hypothetical protein